MLKSKTKSLPNISNRLRHYRKLKRYTQADVAKILNIKPCQVSAWETGIKYPNLTNALKLSILYRRFLLQLFEILYWELFQEIRTRENKLDYE